MERIYFYETLYEKALECANSGDLSDYYDILYDFSIAKFGFEEFFESKRQDVDET